MIKNAIIITVITIVAGVALGLVYEITKVPIANAEENAKREAWQKVFPKAELADFETTEVDEEKAKEAAASVNANALIDEVCTVKGGDEGYVITVTDKEGYGGDVQITVGIASDGTVTGISFLELSETAGLGMKAKEPSFYEQYANKKTDSFYVSKDGGEGEKIDAISGATITSRAVTGAVNTALAYYRSAF
jgi:electron transport complex protein RnfG